MNNPSPRRNLIPLLTGTCLSVGLMVVAIWIWFDASDLALRSEHPDVLRWAARSLAIAAASGSQIIILSLVVGRLYEHRPFHDMLKLTASLICCLSAVIAAALGLAAQG
ncbi:MAG: hypothetical protein KatS3mg104_0241 [Phycisphaerae bacterium]|nr:MAG: hypothetical protein KatS3mg104_0241 [Phycisphaerae bacterium]